MPGTEFGVSFTKSGQIHSRESLTLTEGYVPRTIFQHDGQERLSLAPDMFSASAIANFLACQHIATLDRAESRDEIKRPFFNNPSVDLLRTLGLQHEQKYLRYLVGQDGHKIVEIDASSSWETAVSQTLRAICNGADVIYQAISR